MTPRYWQGFEKRRSIYDAMVCVVGPLYNVDAIFRLDFIKNINGTVDASSAICAIWKHRTTIPLMSSIGVYPNTGTKISNGLLTDSFYVIGREGVAVLLREEYYPIVDEFEAKMRSSLDYYPGLWRGVGKEFRRDAFQLP